jgi:hypothetical protein
MFFIETIFISASKQSNIKKVTAIFSVHTNFGVHGHVICIRDSQFDTDSFLTNTYIQILIYIIIFLNNLNLLLWIWSLKLIYFSSPNHFQIIFYR